MTSIDYWPTLVGKLQKERKIWDHLLRIMGKNGYSPRLKGMFFNAVVQAVLIFRAETWVMIPNIVRALGGGSRTGLHDGSRGSSPSGNWKDAGTNLYWRRWHRKGGSKRLRRMCWRIRPRSFNTSWCDQFWTSARWRHRYRGRGWKKMLGTGGTGPNRSDGFINDRRIKEGRGRSGERGGRVSGN